MKELTHENLNKFYGACVSSNEGVLVTAHCSRGSLQVSRNARVPDALNVTLN